MLFFGGGLQSPRRRNREKSILITILIIFAIYFLFYARSSNRNFAAYDDEAILEEIRRSRPAGSSLSQHSKPHVQKNMVVASMKKDNTSWLFEHFPDWHKSVYVVDDEDAELTVTENKGRESMVYLTCVT